MLPRTIACFASILLVASQAHAQTNDSLPAVSGINGKFSLEGGGTSTAGQSSAIGIGQGSITAPLGHSFGVQIDGIAATAYRSFAGGGDLQLFWRDPQFGLVGAFAGLAGSGGTTVGAYGAQAEIYGPSVTVGAYGGYQSGGASSGGFYSGRLTVYPIPDLALTISGGQYVDSAFGAGQLEYQPDFISGRNVSFFVGGSAGDNSYYSVTGGVRFYFGPVKSLIRRHREDDPLPVFHSFFFQEVERECRRGGSLPWGLCDPFR
jgi:hypothetical protein